jgi:gliding motility-associated-like protein
MRSIQIIICFFSGLLSSFYQVEAQIDDIGSGRALHLDGLDDLVELGNIYDNLHFPITISAWVNLDPDVSNWAPVFVSQDNAPVYNGFWLLVQPTFLSIGYGDGFGENDPAFRRGKTATFTNISNRWTHITGIIRGPIDMDLFINGINVGGTYSGYSDYPMSATIEDIAKIGYWYSNNQIFHFKGKLDEVRIWNKSLSLDEVRLSMCSRILDSEVALIGAWQFNELNDDVRDLSLNQFHGILKGSPARILSGAPIGESSVYDYRSNWMNLTMEINEGSDRLIVSQLQNNPEGVHLYRISNSPSQTSGLDLTIPMKPYFGVFIASLDDDNKFDAVMLEQNKILCKVNTRDDNSIALWNNVGLPIENKLQRAEYLKSPGVVHGFDLGDDISLCHQSSVVVDTKISDPEVSFLWNTGDTTPQINVSQSGRYWVMVTDNCGVSKDTIDIAFLKPPPVFTFGDDQTICPFKPYLLKPYQESTGLDFVWQDGSKNDSLEILDFGVYWVKATNACGEATDTISFLRTVIDVESTPNVITPNGDSQNEYFVFKDVVPGSVSLLIFNRWGKQVFYSNAYLNNWNGPDLAGGVYYYTVSGSCIKEAKGSVTIIR